MKLSTIAMLLAAMALGPSALSAEPKAAVWKPLTDGKTLGGWHPVGDGHWTVEDGVIVGRANNEKLYGLLFSDATFRDATVRFKFKVPAGDSGFYVHTVLKEPDQAHGMQIQVGRLGSGVGGIYESYGRGWISKPTDDAEQGYLHEDDWNDMTIAVHGNHLVVTVNGTTSSDVTIDGVRPEGHFALQMHSGNVMHVMFKDIEILEEGQ